MNLAKFKSNHEELINYGNGSKWEMMMRKLVRCFLMIVGVLVLSIGIWESIYHDADKKDLRYIGWKHGIYPLDPDNALETMVGDGHRDDLVLGKTEIELIKKFGYVTPLSQADDSYYGFCFRTSGRPSQPALRLRNSNWMVLMKNGRAEDLVLLKGC